MNRIFLYTLVHFSVTQRLVVEKLKIEPELTVVVLNHGQLYRLFSPLIAILKKNLHKSSLKSWNFSRIRLNRSFPYSVGWIFSFEFYFSLQASDRLGIKFDFDLKIALLEPERHLVIINLKIFQGWNMLAVMYCDTQFE